MGSAFLYLFDIVPLHSLKHASQRFNRRNRGFVLVTNSCMHVCLLEGSLHRFSMQESSSHPVPIHSLHRYLTQTLVCWKAVHIASTTHPTRSASASADRDIGSETKRPPSYSTFYEHAPQEKSSNGEERHLAKLRNFNTEYSCVFDISRLYGPNTKLGSCCGEKTHFSSNCSTLRSLAILLCDFGGFNLYMEQQAL